jgi:AcrR family transcriptional regulator
MVHDANQRIGFSREKWLEMALHAMADKCISKFSLDSLLKAMPVTKGSFYSHFRNRTDFLVALVDYWRRHDTKSVVDELNALPENLSAQDRLWEMMCVIYDMNLNQYELLIRSMMLEFPEIREAVKAVDRMRLDTVGKIFAEMGFEGDELEMRTLTFVTTMSQDGNVLSELSAESYERQLKLRYEFFIRP